MELSLRAMLPFSRVHRGRHGGGGSKHAHLGKENRFAYGELRQEWVLEDTRTSSENSETGSDTDDSASEAAAGTGRGSARMSEEKIHTMPKR